MCNAMLRNNRRPLPLDTFYPYRTLDILGTTSSLVIGITTTTHAFHSGLPPASRPRQPSELIYHLHMILHRTLTSFFHHKLNLTAAGHNSARVLDHTFLPRSFPVPPSSPMVAHCTQYSRLAHSIFKVTPPSWCLRSYLRDTPPPSPRGDKPSTSQPQTHRVSLSLDEVG